MTASIPIEVRSPSVRRAVAQFAATGMVALVVVAVAGAIVVGDIGARSSRATAARSPASSRTVSSSRPSPRASCSVTRRRSRPWIGWSESG